MAEPEPKFSPRAFLRAIDADQALRDRLVGHNPDTMRQLATYRTNFGDSCRMVRGCLTALWLGEIAANAPEFFGCLRTAGFAG